MSGPVAVHVRVPATSANLGPGFDTLGLALSIYDELEVTALAPGELSIEVTGSGASEIPRDESHLIVTTIRRCFAEAGRTAPGLGIVAHNGIPHGRGLGSSGAAVAAGVLAARGLLEALTGERVLADTDLLRIATEIEGHPDNVAPALFGGLTIAWTEHGAPRYKKLLVHRGVSPVVFVPERTMSTSTARSVLAAEVSREDAVFNVSRSALLIAALTQSPDLLLSATEDKLHQERRAQAMPETFALVRALREQGFAAVVSGAGPSVLVLADGPAARLDAAAAVESESQGVWQPFMLAVDFLGGTVRPASENPTPDAPMFDGVNQPDEQ
ncbi:MAG: homoserine kinase [Microbacterium sp.]